MKKIWSLLLVFLVIASLCSCSNSVCETCNGKQKVTCILCNGRGNTHKLDCSNCKGKGYTIEKCSTCNMKGKITNPLTWEAYTCPSCNGKLTIQKSCSYSGTEQCKNCNGTKYQACYRCSK